MDNFEEKDLDLTEEESSGSSGNEELIKELEEIRDMFQEALDNAGNETDEGETIQELEDVNDYSGPEYAPYEDFLPLCDCCGERRVSTAHGKDYPYCDECRELMKRYPLRIGGVIAIFVMAAVFFLSLYYGTGNLDKTIDVIDAYTLHQQGRMISTLNSLYGYISDDSSDSKKIDYLLVDSFCRAGYFSDAKTYIQNNLTAEELEKPSNKKYKDIVEKIDAFIATQEAIQDIVYPALSGADFDYKETAAKLDEIKESYIDEEKAIKHEAAIIDYFKAVLMKLSNISVDEQLTLLQSAAENDKDGFFLWIYGASLCEAAAKTGNKELAESYFEKLIKNNCEDMSSYKAMACYYRFLETPDTDAMIKLAEQAKNNAQNNDKTYCTILATAYLLKGEGMLAYETMQEYMSVSRYTVSDCNLFALCALYCGNSATYEEMKGTLMNSGYQISPLVEKYKNDEMSIVEVLTDMGGDIG